MEFFMKKYTVAIGALFLACLLLTQCTPKNATPPEEESGAATSGGATTPQGTTGSLEKGAALTTGAELTEAYVALVCGKYDECKIPGFKDREDCVGRITQILSNNEEWKGLQFSKEKMNQCLSEVKTMPCDDFKSGKTPASCTEV